MVVHMQAHSPAKRTVYRKPNGAYELPAHRESPRSYTSRSASSFFLGPTDNFYRTPRSTFGGLLYSTETKQHGRNTPENCLGQFRIDGARPREDSRCCSTFSKSLARNATSCWSRP